MKKKVSCHVITYNHINYISQCIEGIVMQKTNFDFEIIIGDDLSTDGTREIVIDYAQKYPELIRLNLRTERGQGIPGKENFVSTMQMCKGDYVTLCDGDDYWTDPYKLQKQVEFLEANAEYSICWTKYKELDNKNSTINLPHWEKDFKFSGNFNIDLDNVFVPYCTYSLTAIFRKKSFDIDLFKKHKYSKDNTLYAICLSVGKGILLDFHSAVYRLHDGGVYSSQNYFNQKYFSYLNIKEICCKSKIHVTKNIINVRNGLLRQTFTSSPNLFSKKFIYLIYDCFHFLGFKRTILLIKSRFQF